MWYFPFIFVFLCRKCILCVCYETITQLRHHLLICHSTVTKQGKTIKQPKIYEPNYLVWTGVSLFFALTAHTQYLSHSYSLKSHLWFIFVHCYVPKIFLFHTEIHIMLKIKFRFYWYVKHTKEKERAKHAIFETFFFICFYEREIFTKWDISIYEFDFWHFQFEHFFRRHLIENVNK